MATNWISTLEKIAPTAATLLGSPFAGLAVSAVESALGLTGTTSPDSGTAPTVASRIAAIGTAITQGQMTGEQIVAMKNAELSLQQHLADNGTDVASARDREIAVRDNTPRILAYLLTLGFFGILGFLLFQVPPAGAHDVLLILVGSLGTAWAGMIHYYYGSSPGSKLKDATIHSLSV
jgi:ribosomal protein S15P/S13E